MELTVIHSLPILVLCVLCGGHLFSAPVLILPSESRTGSRFANSPSLALPNGCRVGTAMTGHVPTCAQDAAHTRQGGERNTLDFRLALKCTPNLFPALSIAEHSWMPDGRETPGRTLAQVGSSVIENRAGWPCLLSRHGFFLTRRILPVRGGVLWGG